MKLKNLLFLLITILSLYKTEWLFALAIVIPFKKIKLEKEMYQELERQGLTFSDILEKEDPSANYPDGTPDAFVRQLVAYDIKIKGRHVSLIEDFYKTTESRVLFPEFINRNLLIGLNLGKNEATIEDVVSTTTVIDSESYRGIEADFTNSDLEASRVAEGSTFPRVYLKTKDKTITLQKVGYRFDSTYEVIKEIKVNVFANLIQLMGFKLGRRLTYEALMTLLNGDGNSNPAGAVSSSTSGNINFADLLDLQMAITNFESEVLIGNKNTIKKLLLIPEFRDPLIGAKFLTEGQFTTPFGNVIKVNPLFPDNKVLAFNKKAGVEMLEQKSMSLVESDKIIDKQIEQTVFSKIVGFNKLFTDSAYVLNY